MYKATLGAHPRFSLGLSYRMGLWYITRVILFTSVTLITLVTLVDQKMQKMQKLQNIQYMRYMQNLVTLVALVTWSVVILFTLVQCKGPTFQVKLGLVLVKKKLSSFIRCQPPSPSFVYWSLGQISCER